MKTIATLVAGDDPRWRRIADLTIPTFRRYAEKVGADLVELPRGHGHILLDKFGVKNLLDQYDQVLYVDADIIIRDDCPNLFDLVPNGKFAAHNEINRIDDIKRDLLDHRRRVAAENQLDINIDDEVYFNMGVFLVDRSHKSLFDVLPKSCEHLTEQAWLNLRLQQLGTPTMELPQCFNGTAQRYRRYLEEYFVVHYAGDSLDRRLEYIPRDLKIWRTTK